VRVLLDDYCLVRLAYQCLDGAAANALVDKLL
jgi:hypothetical protein